MSGHDGVRRWRQSAAARSGGDACGGSPGRRLWWVAAFALLTSAAANRCTALERVVLKGDQGPRKIEGKLLTTARDGGLLVLAPTGRLWNIPPEMIIKRSRDGQAFEPLTQQQMAQRLREQLPDEFRVMTTAHYVLAFHTSRAYASWCGALLERLYRAFLNFWRRRDFDLHDPQLPLVVVILPDSNAFRQYAVDELGDAATSVVGYYSLRTNHVTMYDLTGVQRLRRPAGRRGSASEINHVLSRPQAEPLVATIIHEATHQIAFNCGLMRRYADIPMWVSEGLAIYFETPDLKSIRGWRGIGRVNYRRLATLRRSLAANRLGTLSELITSDDRLRNVRTAADAYAEAWALNSLLIRRYSERYLKYLGMLADKPPLVWDDPERRLREFRTYLGVDPRSLEDEFQQYIRQLK